MGMTLPNPESPREQARALMARKDALELELEGQLSVLKSNNSDLHTPLVDREGFPKADIDIWAVRTARIRVIELRNDLKSIMDAIARALEGIYDPSLATSNIEEWESQSPSASSSSSKPFAKVEGVAPGSPAAEADMKQGDLVVKFDNLDQNSFTSSSLQPLADLVSQKENSSIMIRVLRSDSLVFLKLTPRKNWGGRGMLGCHIVPYSS
ncbi:hypothetical protein CPB83DRAFT_845895 [Crepidotus variabilis]|uniref:Probable 26S proteasome regulatory subunit p27 n=1 Tax=Crepidotus variabilis TaxID=179855 RepID=A0A9P6EQ89_9AGAR|nr:hypothetical protein CPB83DRAFT_845895 [Crepidotus variabilis]